LELTKPISIPYKRKKLRLRSGESEAMAILRSRRGDSYVKTYTCLGSSYDKK